MDIRDGGVTSPKGFMAAAAAAGIKYQGRDDMAMIFSKAPCRAAGAFTTNIVKAAPVKWDQHIVYDCGTARAVVCNSGIANACTGPEGMESCRQTALAAAKELGTEPDEVLVASTGVIGMQMPTDRLILGVRALAGQLADTVEAGSRAARAIMTTDTIKKEASVSFTYEGSTITIGGMCKGSGMIHPNMCTMLSFLTTDADISQELLQEALSDVVKNTYNMVSVDGDTSTNDTVLLLANGLAGNPAITQKNDGYEAFHKALELLNRCLCRKIAGDGEGATALLEVTVRGAADQQQARTLAKSVVSSSLTKAAVAGHDANWGRILCAMGYSGASFDPDQVDLFFESRAGKLQIMRSGTALLFDEAQATAILSENEVTVTADIHEGDHTATAWGCDLTEEYVKINADYRS